MRKRVMGLFRKKNKHNDLEMHIIINTKLQ